MNRPDFFKIIPEHWVEEENEWLNLYREVKLYRTERDWVVIQRVKSSVRNFVTPDGATIDVESFVRPHIGSWTILLSFTKPPGDWLLKELRKKDRSKNGALTPDRVVRKISDELSFFQQGHMDSLYRAQELSRAMEEDAARFMSGKTSCLTNPGKRKSPKSKKIVFVGLKTGKVLGVKNAT